MIIRRLPIPHHRHHIREDHPRAVILVGIKEDCEALKVICGSKHGAGGAALLGDPHGHAIAVEVAFSVDLKLEFDFPVCGGEGQAGEDPAGLVGSVASEADVSGFGMLVDGSELCFWEELTGLL